MCDYGWLSEAGRSIAASVADVFVGSGGRSIVVAVAAYCYCSDSVAAAVADCCFCLLFCRLLLLFCQRR